MKLMPKAHKLMIICGPRGAQRRTGARTLVTMTTMKPVSETPLSASVVSSLSTCSSKQACPS